MRARTLLLALSTVTVALAAVTAGTERTAADEPRGWHLAPAEAPFPTPRPRAPVTAEAAPSFLAGGVPSTSGTAFALGGSFLATATAPARP